MAISWRARQPKGKAIQLNKYETIHIFFRFSKVISQFVWLFLCLVRVANPFVKLKLHLGYITLRIKTKIISCSEFRSQFTNLTKRGSKHCCALEVLKKIWICLTLMNPCKFSQKESTILKYIQPVLIVTTYFIKRTWFHQITIVIGTND